MAEAEIGLRSVDREMLYAALWTTPGTQLARKYGISDVALGKACRRHDIPRPPPGYWTMRRHGYEVEQTPLPPLADERLKHVEFHPQHEASLRPSDVNHADVAPAARCAIAVAEELSSPHPLVDSARRELRAASADERRILRTNRETTLDIAVARSTITRALKLMDALIRAWESAGGMVKPGAKNFMSQHSTAFAVGPDEVLASLHEKTEPIPNWKPPSGYYGRRYPPHRPTGKLTFAIEYFQREGLRSTWSDGVHRRLEDVLDRIFDGLKMQVENRKRRRLDDECEARQKAAAQKRRDLLHQHQEQEKRRRKQVLDEVGRWHQAERIRAYLDAMHKAVAAGKVRVTDEQVFRDWSGWAEWYANHIDPIVCAKPRPEVVQPPARKQIAELDLTMRTRSVLTAMGVADSDSLHRITEKQIGEVEKRWSHQVWNEVCRVLEALGYDESGRRYWL